MCAAADLVIGEHTEEAFDLTDPGCRGGGEVGMPAGPFGEPLADRLGLVARRIVHHDVDVEIGGDILLDHVEEAAEIGGTVAWHAFADDRADLDVECGERGCRAVPLVVVDAALGLPGPHRQDRLGAVERLDLALLIDAQHHRTVGRVQFARCSDPINAARADQARRSLLRR